METDTTFSYRFGEAYNLNMFEPLTSQLSMHFHAHRFSGSAHSVSFTRADDVE